MSLVIRFLNLYMKKITDCRKYLVLVYCQLDDVFVFGVFEMCTYAIFLSLNAIYRS